MGHSQVRFFNPFVLEIVHYFVALFSSKDPMFPCLVFHYQWFSHIQLRCFILFFLTSIHAIFHDLSCSLFIHFARAVSTFLAPNAKFLGVRKIFLITTVSIVRWVQQWFICGPSNPSHIPLSASLVYISFTFFIFFGRTIHRLILLARCSWVPLLTFSAVQLFVPWSRSCDDLVLLSLLGL